MAVEKLRLRIFYSAEFNLLHGTFRRNINVMEHHEGNANVFGQALIEAQARLADIERRYSTLAKEREQLQALVTSLAVFIPKGTAVSNFAVKEALTVPATGVMTHPPIPPAWKLVEEEFLASGNKSMSVAELAQRLQAKGHKVESKTISVALMRKPNLFIPSGEYGKHKLRSFPSIEQAEIKIGIAV